MGIEEVSLEKIKVKVGKKYGLWEHLARKEYASSSESQRGGLTEEQWIERGIREKYSREMQVGKR